MKLRPSLLALSAALFSSGVGALSLGGALGTVVLGRPFDMRFEIHPDAGATEGRLCLSAEVLQGDGGLGATFSTVTLQPAQPGKPLLVRVQTNTPIREPVVTVQLSVGCSGVVRRSYTLLADLPESQARVLRDASIGVSPLDVVALSHPTLRDLPNSETSNKPLVASTPSGNRRKVVKPAQTGAMGPGRWHAKRWVGPTAEPVVAPAASLAATPSLVTPPPRPEARLVIEPLESPPNKAGTPSQAPLPPPPPEPPPALPVEAGVSVPAVEPAVAENAQWKQMQADITALRSQVQEMGLANVTLQRQLAEAKDQRFSATLVYALLGLLMAALAGAAWLWHRSRGYLAERQEDWAEITDHAYSISSEVELLEEPASKVSPSPLRPSTSERVPPVTPAPPPLRAASPVVPEPAPKPELEPEPELEFFDFPVPPAPVLESLPVRNVIKPEVIFDLQQQAEFFISVGENDQAIGVMKQHIAENETTSPLAYLELLRLYHSLGRVEEFNQLRGQFHRHFNASVPEFANFSKTGSSLLGYVDVLARIEALWNSQDVLEELAHCLFHSEKQGPVFDLNAYDDLMLLYAIAQTTPASARGLPLPRSRTTPQEDEIDLPPLPAALLSRKKGVALSQPPERSWAAPQLPTMPSAPPAPPPASTPTPDFSLLLEPEPEPVAPLPVVPVPLQQPDLVLPAEPEVVSVNLSMDDFSWTPPAPAVAAVASVAPVAAAAPATAPLSAPISPKPSAPGRRLMIDGEEFDLDFSLLEELEGLEQELRALSAPPVVAPVPARKPPPLE